MTLASVIATGLLLLGLLVTGVGAYVASDAVIISEDRATDIAATKWNSNTALKKALIDQSRAARNGLLLVVTGTAFQVAATLVAFFAARR